MSFFDLPGWGDHLVRVTYPEGLTQELIENFPAFKDWTKTFKSSLKRQNQTGHPLNQESYTLRSIDIQAFFLVGKEEKQRPLFLYMLTHVRSKDDKASLPGVVFLRGGSVAVLMILRPLDSFDERHVVMTQQPRVPAGSLEFMEIPAGMLDPEDGKLKMAAARELEEEIGIVLDANDLTNMTEIATWRHDTEEELQHAMYPSAGGCDEHISIFLWERPMERTEIDAMRGRLTGNRAEQEKITVKLLPYESLLDVGARDGKTLAAWALYEYLKRTRQIDENGKQVQAEKRYQ